MFWLNFEIEWQTQNGLQRRITHQKNNVIFSVAFKMEHCFGKIRDLKVDRVDFYANETSSGAMRKHKARYLSSNRPEFRLQAFTDWNLLHKCRAQPSLCQQSAPLLQSFSPRTTFLTSFGDLFLKIINYQQCWLILLIDINQATMSSRKRVLVTVAAIQSFWID